MWGDIVQGLAELIKAALVPFLALRAAQGAEAERNVKILARQNEIAARPDVDDADLDRWLRK
ncbi:hypothetical protein FFK22_024620 [Mycobacterium sp. KBS0706]|uniref:hypothetical protein n=1 Tax=Mycobacterium sp. KBS0706 TaxID=2578109 RepID=UPI00110FF5D1|nr:hypothetical protein [Mycobacterium sp. KBS0706]TSD86007.1 hypothetical protein FFK22_024620 [Mycobacterium sp. KBS0706]